MKQGVPLLLTINVNRVSGNLCEPLAGAYVDIWHCDALGAYSDVRDNGAGFDTRGQKFLRGYQVTNSSGSVEFLTIYPGWYTGRAVHIHFKIRLFTGSQESYEFTSQLYFDGSVSDQVYTQAPYSAKGTAYQRNSQDGIYNNGGSQLTLDLTRSGDGYAATFDIELEGVPASEPAGEPPVVSGASVSGKKLIVTGVNFDDGANVYLNGDRQKKTDNDDSSPTTILVARKAGKKVSPGATVMLQVRNADGSLSNEYEFTRPSA